MRIKLQEGKQKELILKAKEGKTWKELAEILNINEVYLYYELKKEKRCLKEELYKTLCKISNKDMNQFIVKRLEDNWGQIKGGINSNGSMKNIPKVLLDEKLAEFIGAVLGDGHICYIKKGKKIGVYCIKIAGDLKKDKNYHLKYLKPLAEKIFQLKVKERIRKKNNERFLDLYSKKLVEFFISLNLLPGNKIINQSTIPKWIFNQESTLKACIRGIIDTDGSIHRRSNKNPNLLRISFTNHDLTLLKDVRKGLIKLGFNPSKIIMNRSISLSRQNEINKYLKEIGFSNDRHKKRLNHFKSLVV